MKPKERQAYILEKARQEGTVTIEELGKIFSVSLQSIRKDVNILCKQELLRRVYGGVSIMSQQDNISHDSRKIIYYSAKKQIASLISKMIPNGTSLFFSIGTTPQIVAKALLNHENLTIITNNINIALECSQNDTFKIILHGGVVRNRYGDILGSDIEEFFSKYSVEYGIFGVGAIEEDGALLDFSIEELKAREAISKHSKKVFLVADYSKFQRKAFVKGGFITQADAFFCDKKPPKHIYDMLKQNNTELFYTNRTT